MFEQNIGNIKSTPHKTSLGRMRGRKTQSKLKQNSKIIYKKTKTKDVHHRNTLKHEPKFEGCKTEQM